MILKRMKSASTIVLLSIVLCTLIHDVAGGPTDRVERAATPMMCGKSRAARGLSIGGNHTVRNSWPWLVALRKELPGNKSKFFCAGSLIAKRHVVSGEDE
jgi:hypothetical protein